MLQACLGWLGGPRPLAVEGGLFWVGGGVAANTAFRFRLQQWSKLRVAGDLELSENRAAALRAPINLLSGRRDSAAVAALRHPQG